MSVYARKILLATDNAGCDRGGTAVLRGLTVELGPGEAVQLFGANGSGKTSLLSMLSGLTPIAEGTVEWTEGANTQHHPFDNSLLFLGHENSVKASLTVEENLSFWLSNTEKPARQDKIISALQKVGIVHLMKQRTSTLSMGQKRRVDIARACLEDREVWLMDEPAAALDVKGETILCELINDHLARGGSAILATHRPLDIHARRLELSS